MSCDEYRSSPEVRTGFINGETFERLSVRYSVIGNQAIFEGDIVLGTVDEMERLVAELGTKIDTQARGVVRTGKRFRWPGGVVPFTIDPALPNVNIGRVNEAITHWHNRTRIRLVARTSESNFLTFRPGDGCSSQIGMQGGQQFITLGSGCSTGNTIHEIGHTVGLWHEQSREDRDQFIKIVAENIEAGKEHNFDQHITDGDDVGAYDYGSIMHYDELAFSKNDKPTIEALNGQAIGQRLALSDGDVQAVNYMYFPSVPFILQQGVYSIQQKSNGRFVDAHEYAGKDFALVTRPVQNNETQRWFIRPVGGVYKIQQKSNGRFVDAHEIAEKDFSLVTRNDQNNDSQQWILMHVGGPYTMQQKSNGRLVNAHNSSGKDFAVVTRPAQQDESQQWNITLSANNSFIIQQKSTGRYMDAHEIEGRDFALVTRPAQDNNTQLWTLIPVGVICTIQQNSNGRFADAHDSADKDFALVTRTAQDNDSQLWVITALGSNVYSVQQKSTNRYWDAHEIEEKDFALVTRPAQNNNTQRWLIKAA